MLYVVLFESDIFLKGKFMDRDLNKLGLMQLRIYAKSIGVKAPTAYTKIKLIEKIKQVEEGIVPPHFSDRGRPQLNTFIDFNDNLNEKILP